MSQHDDRLDQALLARLWALENAGEQDDRAALAGGRFLSLFLDKLGSRSGVLEHGSAGENEELSVGDAEAWVYDTRGQAEVAFGEMLREARSEGRLLETGSLDGLGDPAADGPTTTEVGEENLDNA